ncbi:hypothetical protein HYALB_00000503 [Hymenoscyphus albidus]|uniref:Carboxylic ester hydrolase n=1 Tax=Hymenoscyphus albidus TaxID=595503 RepID=A0A9N9M344_9HELO|nr:hypothetical protein HYALB_00000503 [Hymenoscyphus albidus]
MFFSSLTRAFALFLSLVTLVSLTLTAEFKQILNFGNNPGHANIALEESQFSHYQQYADNLGFIVIYPESVKDYKCWDVNRYESLHHYGGSDSLSIVNMVHWAPVTYLINPKRVYTTGWSSGALMSQTLAAAYPEVFASFSAFSGAPYGCLKDSPASSLQAADLSCIQGKIIKSPQEWGDLARSAYPGFFPLPIINPRPKMQPWHGTEDDVITYAVLNEEIKQWTNVLGVSFSHNETDTPRPGYTKMVYGDGSQLVVYSCQGVGHRIPNEEVTVLKWFEIL